MWSVVLKILSILGIILLCLLVLVLVTALLVLFWPAAYRGGGTAQAGELRAWFRFRWLFGLVRGSYAYPGENGLRIKALWMTVYESGGKGTAGDSSDRDEESLGEKETAAGSVEQSLTGQDLREPQSEEDRREEPPPKEQASARETSAGKTKAEPEEKSRKLSDLKEKLRFYLGIARDEDNRELVKHAFVRLGKIIKSIRPRYMRAKAVAGLGEPDLTGYAYGIYWAVNPFLGKKCQVDITPDFEQRILEGEVFLKGHVTLAVLLYHVCKVLLDRRLRQLLDRLKNQ